MGIYERQLERLQREGKVTNHIEEVVGKSINNIDDGCKSFIIYGEPQSGKTEMMISLTAKLLDSYEDYRIIIVLLNDNVKLLEQNYSRFVNSRISPRPLKFADVLKPFHKMDTGPWIIFAKKNANDLNKLITKVNKYEHKVIIDDEADYATPNSKVNKEKQTRINELTEDLIGEEGIYIGVTATPARLDLNRTHDNENDRWVNFEPYAGYKGRDYFFPYDYFENEPKFLNLMPDERDSIVYLRDTLFSFISNVAYLNYDKAIPEQNNYTFLIHTSGIKDMHLKDEKDIHDIFTALCDKSHKKHNSYIEQIRSMISNKYPCEDIDKMLEYVIEEAGRKAVIVMNSDNTSEGDYEHATSPTSPFTVVIGGNIISRGVTFDNLLSMFFTRDVKHKMQQDTYIQRARMFGKREDYIDYFELHIPKTLYADWNECFFYNKLSLELLKESDYSPIWIDSQNTSAVASGSIKRVAVISSSGEVCFGLFDYTSVRTEVENILQDKNQSSEDKLNSLSNILGPYFMPKSLIRLMAENISISKKSIAIHEHSRDISGRGDDTDKENILRKKGLIGSSELNSDGYGDYLHHIFLFHNENTGKARVYYKIKHANLKFHQTKR